MQLFDREPGTFLHEPHKGSSEGDAMHSLGLVIGVIGCIGFTLFAVFKLLFG